MLSVMKWILLATLAPFLWSVSNIIDEYLISHYYKKRKLIQSSSLVGSLVLFSSLFGIVVCSLVAVFNSAVFDIDTESIKFLILSGVLTVGWIISYLIAIEDAGASAVAPWFQTIPIFGFIFGYIFLGEIPLRLEIIGSVVVIIGAIIVSIDRSGRGVGIKARAVFLMILASLLVALSGSVFKSATIHNDFWTSTFWEYFGITLTGCFIFMFHGDYRREFVAKLRASGVQIIGANLINESVSSVGNIINNFALVLAPVALVYSVNAVQPLIVLGLSVFVTWIWPKLGRENMSKRMIIWKTAGVLLVVLGGILISLAK